MSSEKIIEARVKEREKRGKRVQDLIDQLAKEVSELADHDLKTYSMLYKPDALWTDCPISAFHTFNWIKKYMIKKDMDFIGYEIDGKVSIKDLSERIKESSPWVMRFAKEPEKEKSGIEAIL